MRRHSPRVHELHRLSGDHMEAVLTFELENVESGWAGRFGALAITAVRDALEPTLPATDPALPDALIATHVQARASAPRGVGDRPVAAGRFAGPTDEAEPACRTRRRRHGAR